MSDTVNNTDDVESAKKRANGFAVVIVFQAAALLVGAIALFFHDPQARFVPTRTCQEYSLSSSDNSASYYEQLGYEDALTMFNLTPDTVGLNKKVLLRRAAPSAHAKLEAWFTNQALQIRERGYKFSFFIENTHFDDQSGLTLVKGELETRLGGKTVGEPTVVIYGFKYLPETGQIADLVEIGDKK